MSLYQDGKFIYTKMLDFGINQLYAAFKELYHEKDATFDKFLLVCSHSFYPQIHDEIFSMFFKSLQSELTHIKRLYKTAELTHIYIDARGFQTDTLLQGFKEFFQIDARYVSDVMGTEETKNSLLLLYAKYHFKGVNFSTRLKKPLLSHAQTFLLVILTSLFLSLASPLYDLYQGHMIAQNMVFKQHKIENLKKDIATLYAPIDALEKEHQALEKKVRLATQKIEKEMLHLSNVAAGKKTYVLKSDVVFEIAQVLEKEDVKIKELRFENDLFSLEAVSHDENAIASFLKKISQRFTLLNIRLKQEGGQISAYATLSNTYVN